MPRSPSGLIRVPRVVDTEAEDEIGTASSGWSETALGEGSSVP